MTKHEFLEKMRKNSIKMGEYIMVLDKITDDPLVMGCVLDNGRWKVFETRERGGHFIIKELDYETEAFDYFYELLLSRHNYLLESE